VPSLHAGHVVCRKCGGHGEIEDRRYGVVRGCRQCREAGRTDEFHRVEVTAAQLLALGFAADEKPAKLKLGCGMDACAYAAGSDSVVKITKDARDAVAAAAIRALDPQPLWAVPIRAVYRLAGEAFVLVLARAEVPLPPEWAEPIEGVFRDTADEKKWGAGGLRAHEWRSRLGYEGWIRNIDLADIRHGPNETRKKLRRAVETIDEMMRALAEIGLDGSDFHPGNWGMYQGRPVILDFGMARLRDRKGKPIPPKDGVRIPDRKDIPVLPSR
jgi:hypothetical protein